MLPPFSAVCILEIAASIDAGQHFRHLDDLRAKSWDLFQVNAKPYGLVDEVQRDWARETLKEQVSHSGEQPLGAVGVNGAEATWVACRACLEPFKGHLAVAKLTEDDPVGLVPERRSNRLNRLVRWNDKRNGVSRSAVDLRGILDDVKPVIRAETGDLSDEGVQEGSLPSARSSTYEDIQSIFNSFL